MEGSRETGTITSRINGTTYPLNVYLPPASAGPRSGLPVVYVLDGESWFETLVGIAESTHTRIIIVAISTAGLRGRDFVPQNNCTPDGGGHTAYFNFIRQELIPHVEGTFGGSPSKRTLFGHSHGGMFVFYALFAQAPGQHTFKTYLASDASVGCTSAAHEWEQSYATAYRELPVRLHVSYATQGNYAANLQFADVIARRNYERLTFTSQSYSGTHGGIVPQVLTDGIAFSLAGSP
jgi:hypothetical protein